MQQYRLLRNNKESGPYTLKELAHLPLKPYDLVWVDGKSAAWRYPSELPEFKEVAPRVEEDFYEQFHRRPAEKKETTVHSSDITEKAETIAAPVVSELVAQASTPAVSSPNDQRKKVAVILPESAAPLKQEPVLRVVKKEAASPAQEAPELIKKTPAPEPVIDQLQVPPPKQAKKKISLKPYYWAAGLFVLAATTLMLSLFTADNRSAGIEANSNALPLIQTGGAIDDISDPGPSLPENPALEFAALKRFLTVRPDQIKVGMFGGIKGLQLVIKNNHSQPIADIQIAVDFLEKDQSLHHTEIVEVAKMEAGSTQSIRVQANGKGRAVQTRIIGIGKYKP